MRAFGGWVAAGLFVFACGKARPGANPLDPETSQPTANAVNDTPQNTENPPSSPLTLMLPGPGRLYHGVLPAGNTNPDSDVSEDNLNGYEQAVGRPVAYVYFSTNWYQTKSFPIQTATWVRARGSVPFIRLMLRSEFKAVGGDSVYTLQRIVNGDFDGDLQAWADGAKAFGTPLVVEYGTEINGDWYPWSQPYNGGLDVGPALFRTAYRHIVTLMRARGANNIQWALHFNAENYPQDPRNVPKAYYPGDDVVDWVGVSVYADQYLAHNHCLPFASLMDEIIPQFLDATTTKPFFVFEFGTTAQNPSCPAGPWAQTALHQLLSGRWPNVKGFSWWNENWGTPKDLGNSAWMQVQTQPELTAAFHDALNGELAGNVVDRPILQ